MPFNSLGRSDRAPGRNGRYNECVMATIRRSPPPQVSRPLIAVAAAVAFLACRAAVAGADEPLAVGDPPALVQAAARSAPQTRLPADVARLFRFHAAAEANALRDAVERATFDEMRRDELRLLVREHLRRVEDEVARVAAATALDDVLARAADIARDFNDRQVATWLDEHPAVYQPVQEQIALAEAYERSVAEEPEAIVRAARAAGLPPEREAGVRRVVTDAHERLRKADEADERRLHEAAAKAAASAPPAQAAKPPTALDRPEPPPPAAGGANKQQADAPPADASPADAPQRAIAPPSAPRPPTAEEEKLHLLDALTFIDAQARVAAAGREVRAEVEKLLPHPPQRKALDDEMLRWYQTYAPPPEEPEQESVPDRAPQRPGASSSPRPNTDPRPRPDTRRVPPRFDPGF